MNIIKCKYIRGEQSVSMNILMINQNKKRET